MPRGRVLCYTIRGTLAGLKLGPDLTHLAGLTTIAAGALANVRGHLVAWILDPPSFKPGAQMPASAIESGELEPLLNSEHT
jgi:cytochrome c oxidase subunit 2